MADEKIITSSVFEQGVTEIMQDIANNLYEFEEYTEEEVADLMDLSEEEVAELTRVINDTTVALNKVYSNKKVEDLLSELEVTCNKYADEKIGGLANIHLAYVDSLPSVGEDNTIYILKSTTGGNDTLNLYNNGWISIGEFAISLDNYYDKAEVDALLNDKANANEVITQNDVVSDMSNISSSTVLSTAGLEVELNKKVNLDDMTTELNKKVDKDSIATVLDDTVTDDEVASAKAVYDELNTKANDDEVVKKTVISNTIDSKSTDSEIPTSKAVYDSTKYSSISLECPIDKSPLEFVIENMKDNTILYFNSWGNSSGATPDAWASYIGIRHKDRNNLFLIDINAFGSTRVNTYRDNVWSGWRKVCTASASVPDVGKTIITLNTMSDINFGDVNGCYLVSNGICTVDITFNCTTTARISWATVYNSLPIPKSMFHASAPASNHDTPPLLINVNTNGTMEWYIDSAVTDNRTYYVHFSYPVAE